MEHIEYISGGIELLDLVKPLWEKLREHHEANSEYFIDQFAALTFEKRKMKLLSDSITNVRIDLIKDAIKNEFIGYCITTVSNENRGEIESLYLDVKYRKLGVGNELMTKALRWMDDLLVETKVIGVAEGNEDVLNFYRKYGFYKRRIILEQIKPK